MENIDTKDVPVLRRAAMDCLARREHSLHELKTKLTRKFPDLSPHAGAGRAVALDGRGAAV